MGETFKKHYLPHQTSFFSVMGHGSLSCLTFLTACVNNCIQQNNQTWKQRAVPFSSWTLGNDISPLKRKLSRLLCNSFIYSRWYSASFKHCLHADHRKLKPASRYSAFRLLYQFRWDYKISTTVPRCVGSHKLNCDWGWILQYSVILKEHC